MSLRTEAVPGIRTRADIPKNTQPVSRRNVALGYGGEHIEGTDIFPATKNLGQDAAPREYHRPSIGALKYRAHHGRR